MTTSSATRQSAPLSDNQEMEVVLADGSPQRTQDGRGIVMRTLDEQGLAIASETYGAGARPRPEMTGACPEVGSGLEPERPRVLDRAEHEVPRQLSRSRQRRRIVGAEELADEGGQLAAIHAAGTEGVLHSQAVDVDQVAADGNLAATSLARAHHGHQAGCAAAGFSDIAPLAMPLDDEAAAPARAHPESRRGGLRLVRALLLPGRPYYRRPWPRRQALERNL